MKSRRLGRLQEGFTILELMVAMLVFSAIMVIITYGVLHFTNSYYQGTTTATTQDAARNIMDTINQAIQFSGGDVSQTDNSAHKNYFCVGGKVFWFRPGEVFQGDPSASPGLYVMTMPCPTSEPSYSAGGQELLSEHMRIAVLQVTPVVAGSPSYNVNLRLVYSSSGGGTNDGIDLLCAPTQVHGSCDSGGLAATDLNDPNVLKEIVCKASTAGSQFCAVSATSTVVRQRVGT